jgi:hypothetical protein
MNNQPEWVVEEEVVFAHFRLSHQPYSPLFPRFGTAFPGDDFFKGMMSVYILYTSGSRLISLFSLLACSSLTPTQLSGWCPSPPSSLLAFSFRQLVAHPVGISVPKKG